MITPVFCFSDDNIDRLHVDLMKAIVVKGKDLKFGDKDEIKMARECYFTVQVHGKGIKRLLDGKVPKGVKFKGNMIKEFQDSFFTEDFNPHGFEYSCPQLMKKWPVTPLYLQMYEDGYISCYKPYDQIEISKDLLQQDIDDDICSNRNVGILYNLYMAKMKDKPCFNWFQIRYNGNGMVSLRFLFRSHDYVGGIWPNLCGLVKAFYKLVVEPNGCKIEEVILTSTSGHAYESDSDEAELMSSMP